MKKGPKKLKTHVNLDAFVGELLDAVAAKMGEDPLYPTPSRSDLLNKAAWLYLEHCKARPELKETIDRVVDARTTAAQATNIIPYQRASKPATGRNRTKNLKGPRLAGDAPDR